MPPITNCGESILHVLSMFGLLFFEVPQGMGSKNTQFPVEEHHNQGKNAAM